MCVVISFKKIISGIGSALLVLAVAVNTPAQTHEQHTTPAGTKLWLYTPAGYSPGTPAPMLVTLHGFSEIGDDLTKLTSGNTTGNPTRLIHQGLWLTSRPFIVVSPQLKPDGTGLNQDWNAALIDEVVEYAKTQRTIDNNRIYFTGLSLGGQGCMIYAAAFPQKVAAMVSISSRTSHIISTACSLTNIPLWAFHGSEDLTVFPFHSIDMVNAINACNPTQIKPQLTLLQAGRHEGTLWDPIYNLSSGYSIYEWLLKFVKNDNTNRSPYVSAGSDKKFLVSSNSIYLPGYFFDVDGTVASVEWVQTSGAQLSLENTTGDVLKVNNLQAGTFEFELRVTDNLGALGTDRVIVEVLNSTTLPVLNTLTLINGTTNEPIGELVDGQVINKNILGISEINIRATPSGGGSVRFQVNENQNTRAVSTFFPQNILLLTNTQPTEWRIQVGDYVVCAAPFTGGFSGGNVTGTQGISKCVQLHVFDQPIREYFSQPGLDVSLLTSWGLNTNGTGTAPESFTGAFQVFNVTTTSSQNGSWSVGGIESFLWVRNGGELTINNSFNGVINIEAGGIVNINTSTPVFFGSVSPNSTIRFGAAATTIPAGSYGNIIVQGSGTTKTLGSGNTTIAGNLTIENGVGLNGVTNGGSTVLLAGNLILEETDQFIPLSTFKLTLTSGGAQTIQFAGVNVAFEQLTITGGTQATMLPASGNSTIVLGSASGGGLVIQNEGEFILGKNNLSIIGSGTINSQNQTGRIGFDKSKLSLITQAAANTYIYPKPGAETASTIIANFTGGGALFLQDSLFVLDSVKSLNGALHSNGFLTLLSSATKTACIASIEGTGTITGDVMFQRFVRSGRLYRYMSFPLQGVRVIDLQNNHVPVTGSFAGASTGFPGNPSLFHYQEPEEWLPYPTISNMEQFELGKGYAVFMRDETSSKVLKFSGPIHQGNFNFTLQSGSTDPVVGWNLLGNPYAAPVQWGKNWIASGVNANVYVRDNEYPGGRFLVWDGVATGDLEFAGLIAQGQSFWVKSVEENAQLVIQENSKGNTQAELYRTREENNLLGLTITLQQGELIDRTYLKLVPEASTKFIPMSDAVKQRNGYYNLSVRTADSVYLAIKNLPDSCESRFDLSIQDAKPGNYTLYFSGSIFEANKNVYLVDTKLDSTITINSNELYSFSITEDNLLTQADRFKVIIQTNIPKPVITIDGIRLVSSVPQGNQWYLNGTKINGATEDYYVPLETGNYHVQVYAQTCFKTSNLLPYIVTGIEKRFVIEIYPNPASERVAIIGFEKPVDFSICTMLGQCVQKGQLSTENNHSIDLMLATGVYILKLHDDGIIHQYRLLIKR